MERVQVQMEMCSKCKIPDLEDLMQETKILKLSISYITYTGLNITMNCTCVLYFFIFLFLGQRETEHERGRGRERGRHRIGNRLQALSHQPRARRGARTHGPRGRDLAEVGRLTDCATQAPQALPFFIPLETIPTEFSCTCLLVRVCVSLE